MKKIWGKLKHCLSAMAIAGMLFVPQTVKAADVSVSSFEQLKAAIADTNVKTIDVAGNIDISEELTINGEKEIKAASNAVSLKLINEAVDNMFVVSQGNKVSFLSITLDGDKKGRIIDANKGATITIKDSIVVNGSTETFGKKINSATGANEQRYSGGAIHADGAILNLENTNFEDNETKAKTPKAEKPGDVQPSGHGGAILATGKTIINVKGGQFSNNRTGITENTGGANGEGGAIKLEDSTLNINDESTTDKGTTKFTGNHLASSYILGGMQGGAIEATNSKVNIYGTSFEIVGPFNTGGAIKFEHSTGVIKNSDFTITSKMGNDFGVAGGAITSEESDLTIEETTMKTSPKARVREAGGLIQVVGGGSFNLKKSVLEGSGAAWNAGLYTANTGGAISFYSDSTVKALIEDTEIKNFMVDRAGAGIAIARYNGEKANVNLTLRNTNIINTAAYTYANSSYGGAMYIGAGENNVTIEGGKISGQTYSNTAGGIYNLGHLTITGGAEVSGNNAYQMAGGIYNDGYLKIDDATIRNNKKGDGYTGDAHIYKNAKGEGELSGENIYADKDVIITPNAKFDGKDVRVLDGQSAIILTGALTNKIQVSVSESPKAATSTNPNETIFAEDAQRYIGYVVAKGDGSYVPTEEDAKFLHYVSKDASQKISAYDDHTGLGAWDYVLDPNKKEVVLGQRAKLVYHSNGTDDKPAKFETNNDKKEQLYTIYSSKEPWSTPGQMTKIDQVPSRDGFDFTGWYLNVPSSNEAAAPTKNNDHDIQNIENADVVKEFLFNFGEVKFVKDSAPVTTILNPYIMNTYAGWSKTITIPVEKVWVDALETDKKDVTIHLFANGQEVDSMTVTKDKQWKGEFTNKSVYKQGANGLEPITYTVTEDAMDGFRTEIAPKAIVAKNQLAAKEAGKAGETFKVTNAKINKFDLEVTKVWDDSDNTEGLRPAMVSITLTPSSGKAINASISKNEKGEWKHTFKDLLKKDDAGKEITYTLSEAKVDKYEAPVISEITFDANSATKASATITNKRVVEYMTIEGKKVWDDADNQDGLRPLEITVNLKDGEDIVGSKPVNGNGNEWSYSFENVQKYRNGKVAAYTVDEEAISAEYTKTISGTTITNSHKPKLMDIEVEKIWDDADNQDGKRPTEITVVLLADDQETDKSITIKDDGNGLWKNSFKDLPVFKDGKQIVYTVKEVNVGVDGYTSKVDSYKITNSYVPEVIVISGEKTWNDNQNQDGKRPEMIRVSLMNGDTLVETVEVSKDTEWKYTFKETPKYEKGQVINYTVKEEAVEGYKTSYDGYNVSNTHEPEKVSLKLTKVWEDGDDFDKIRPNSVSVILYANEEEKETIILSADEGWTKTIEGLDKYKDGKEIVYSLKETEVKDYSSKIIGNISEGFLITNSHTLYPRYKQTHEFVSGSKDKSLPKAIVDRTPAMVDLLLDGSETVPGIFDASDYKDEVNKGLWTFKAWDYEKQLVKGADVHYIGEWVFTADKEPDKKPKTEIKKPNKKEKTPKANKSKTPVKGKYSKSKNVPKTGDSSNMTLYLLVLAAAFTTILSVRAKRKQDK